MNDNRSRSLVRRAVILAALAAFALLLAVPGAANPPGNVVMNYDQMTDKFTVTITHPVDDPAKHYINKVQVKYNGRVISDPDYKSQPTKDTFTYDYTVSALPGDTFWVYITCNQGGSVEKQYDIPVPVTTIANVVAPAAPAEAPAPVPPTQKSPAGILPLFGAAAAVLLLRKI